jgi:tetratricopeptide (TPR) repeat protein
MVVVCLAALPGCTRTAVERPPETAAPEPVAPVGPGSSDQFLLEEALKGRVLSTPEIAGLSDRLLGEGSPALKDEKAMARLEILLLKSLKGGEDKAQKSVLWRNLGILHYHQRKYKHSRQELQAANELNPRDGRTHFYLARLFARQGEIYERQGKKKVARQQLKRAAMEVELARKFEPGNSLYRQDLKQILQQEQGK